MENAPENRNSRNVLAWILIGVGIFWLLRRIGFHFEFPNFYYHIIDPIRHAFHGLFGFIFSLPVVLIIVGLVLMAGKRSAGIVLIVIGGIFLLPKLFFLTGITISMLFPLVLIAIGVAMILKRV